MYKTCFLILALILFSGNPVSSQTYGDYTLYSVQNGTKAYLIKMDGTTYHTFTFASNSKIGYSSYLLPNRVLLSTVLKQNPYFGGGGVCGGVQKIDWNNNVVWDFTYSTSQYCSHHDICPMPNGNVLLIAYEVKSSSEVTQAGCTKSITMWPDKIVEIQPSGTTGGTVVWEWHVWNHLCQNANASKDNYVTSIVDHPELLNINYQANQDWMHVNGIDYNADLDQITFSSHNLNEIYVIDHSTTTAEAAGHTGGNSGKGGDFLYRWGNPAAYQASGTTIFNIVHDAHWVPANCPRAGYLAGFNNRGGSGGKSCVDLIEPPYNGYNYTINVGSAFAPSTYSWRHTYSGNPIQDLGNSQQLPNGNTLICISGARYIYEIDSNQTTVWSKTVSGASAHAYRYTACYVDGMSVPTITLSGTSLISSEAPGYQWYMNGDSVPGATNQTFDPALSASYQVRANDGNGCYSALSEAFNFIASSSPEQSEESLLIYPNPSTGEVNISGTFLDNKLFTVVVSDMTGKPLLWIENNSSIDLSSLKNGIYFLKIKLTSGSVLIKKIILSR